MIGARRVVASDARISTSGKFGLLGVTAGHVVAALTIALMSLWYFASRRHPSENGYHTQVNILGGIAIFLSLGAVCLSVRKRLAHQGIGRLSIWLGLHVDVGIVAVFAVLYHSGFKLGARITTLLLLSFVVVAVSGVLGLWLSRTIPRLLTALEETPAIIEQLLQARMDCFQGMLDLSAVGSEDLRRLVSGPLLSQTASWTRIVRFYRLRSTVQQELAGFLREYESSFAKLDAHDQRVFNRAAEYALRINKMNAELFLHRLLRNWLTMHIVSTTAMFGLAAIHIVSVLYY